MMIHLRFLVMCIIAGNDKMVATDAIEVLSYHCHYGTLSHNSSASHCPEYRIKALQLDLTQTRLVTMNFKSFSRIFEYGIALSRLSPVRLRVIVQKSVRIPYTTVKSNRRSIYRIRMISITANGPLNAFEHRGRKKKGCRKRTNRMYKRKTYSFGEIET